MNIGSLLERCKEKFKWSEDFTKRVFKEYQWFINMKICDKNLSPSYIIDMMWHEHILDTVNYRKFCGEHFIDHDPNGSKDTFNQAQRYYKTVNLLKSDHDIDKEIWPDPEIYIKIMFCGNSFNMPCMSWDKIKEYLKRKRPDVNWRFNEISFETKDEYPKKFSLYHTIIVLNDNLAIKRRRTRSETRTHQIFIKDLNGKTITLESPKSTGTIWELKENYIKKLQLTFKPEDIRFVFGGRTLKDIESTANISKEATIHVIQRLRGC